MHIKKNYEATMHFAILLTIFVYSYGQCSGTCTFEMKLKCIWMKLFEFAIRSKLHFTHWMKIITIFVTSWLQPTEDFVNSINCQIYIGNFFGPFKVGANRKKSNRKFDLAAVHIIPLSNFSKVYKRFGCVCNYFLNYYVA